MIFVLLGRDVAAPETIRYWANERIRLGKNTASDPEITEALECAATMETERLDGALVPDVPIERLEIGVRSYNCLRNGYLCNMEDGSRSILALEYPAGVRHFGQRSYVDICLALLNQVGIFQNELFESPWWRTAPSSWCKEVKAALADKSTAATGGERGNN
jgi:hypothetical protein